MSHRFWQERLRIDGKRADGFIESRVVGATLVKRMEGAASLELACTDPDEAILKSGLLDRPGKPGKRTEKIDRIETAAWAKFAGSRIQLDGIGYRLARVDGNYDASDSTITLTFEDEVAPMMRRVTSPVKLERDASNAVKDRAGFIHMLAIKAEKRAGFPFEFYAPYDAQNQVEIRAPDVKQYQKGLDRKDKLTIKAFPAQEQQLHNLTLALTVADEKAAPELAVLALLCAGIGESSWRDVMNANQVPVDTYLANPGAYGSTSGYGGVLQGRVTTSYSPNWFRDMKADERTREEVESFLVGGRGYQGGGAIALARQHPDWPPGRIAITVEGAFSNFSSTEAAIAHYQVWHKEAEDILEAWGGASKVRVRQEKFEFRAGGTRDGVEHNYWMDAIDLAKEVRWRLFAYHNILWYVPDEWLFQRFAQFILDEGRQTPGVHGIQFQADIGLPISEFVVRAHVERWDGAPGGVVKVQDLGPFTGRWLLWEERQDCFTEIADFTLRRPAPDIKEPAPKVKVKEVVSGDIRADKRGARGIVEDCIRIAKPFGVYAGNTFRGLGDVVGSGAPSDHSELGKNGGHDPTYRSAVDLGVKGIDFLVGPPSSKIDETCAAICEMLSTPYDEGDTIIRDVQFHGYRVQLIWRTPLYGGHMGHLHVGVRSNS